MEPKTSEWRPGPTVCRCCLTEGCYKDISTEYFWMGKREVYAEMLSETFSVSISYSKSGGPNSNSRLICEPCISRLRDAADFRRQVLECEKMFIQHLDPGSSSLELEVSVEPAGKDVKLERVKVEKLMSDDEFDDRGFPDDDDDDDDEMDNQPLTKLASKVPKKESVDLMDLLDNSKVVLKRKSTTKTKATVPNKKLKTKKDVKAAPSKPASKPLPKPVEKKKKEISSGFITRRNAKLIVQYSTAYPFRLSECAMSCVFCESSFSDATRFRKHMKTEHEEFKAQDAFWHVKQCNSLTVDCTALSCRICFENCSKLDEMAAHLKTHSECEKIDLDQDLDLEPFTLHKDQYYCSMCDKKGISIRGLSKHMQDHCVRYNCEACGKSYASIELLYAHANKAHEDLLDPLSVRNV